MEDKNKAVTIINKAKEDFSSGKISRREFNSIMMTFGAIAGYTLFNSFAHAWTGTRMRRSSGAAYQIQRSLRFRASVSAYLSRTPASAGNQLKWTFSAWVKRGLLSYGGSGGVTSLFTWRHTVAGMTGGITFNTNDTILFAEGPSNYRITNAVRRDPSAWMHVVAIWDSGNATDALRCQIYINGDLQTYSTAPAITLNTALNCSTATPHTLAADQPTTGVRDFFDGYFSEINFIDGQALTPTNFGQVDAITGAWTAKKYSGIYGTNGFYLPLTDTSSTTNLVKDTSGNSNNWTPNNISLTAGVTYDSMTDVPLAYGTTDRGNFCVFNQLSHGSQMTISEGNLKAIGGSNSENAVLTTIGMTSGLKFYAEFTAVSATNTYLGIALGSQLLGPGGGSTAYIGDATGGYGLNPGGSISYNAGVLATVATYTNGSVIGIAYDGAAGTLQFYINNTAVSYTVTGIDTSKTWFFATSSYTATEGFVANFGQSAFNYTPPAGFAALHTGNLATPAIKKSSLYFDTALWTADGTARNYSLTSNFTPDLVWWKCRSTAESHRLIDTVRGKGTTYYNSLKVDSTAGESEDNEVTNLSVSGLTVAGAGNSPNVSGRTYVAWSWKKGVTPGFDIVSFAGQASGTATIAHSLGVIPKMIIFKYRTAVSSMFLYHSSLPSAAYYLTMQTSNAQTSDNTVWNSTAPTASVFTLGTSFATSSNWIAYCFAEIIGFSKFGSYTGNGSADGPFVYCGFKPRFVVMKRSDGGAEHWNMFDSSRDGYNSLNKLIYGNLTNTEDATAGRIDLLSNGFKARDTGSGYNTSGATYIFMAFAEAPFKYASAR